MSELNDESICKMVGVVELVFSREMICLQFGCKGLGVSIRKMKITLIFVKNA
jgi:hypothetical protein